MLLDITNELVALILQFLEPQDLLSARLACKALYLASPPALSAHFFAVVTTNLTKASIEWLQKLLDHETYRYAVRKIRISPAGRLRKCGDDLHWPRFASHQLQWLGQDAVLVQNLLSAFPKCASFSVERDGANQLHSSYGTSEDYLITGDLMTILLSTLAMSQQPIRSASFDFTGARSDHCLSIVPADSYASQQSFWERWSNLTHLSFRVPLDYNGLNAPAATDLVSRAASLERLDFEDTTPGGYCGPRLVDCMLEATCFPSLTHLKLRGIANMHASNLVALLERLQRSLTHLWLHWITVDGSWKEVCLRIGAGLPKLRCLTLCGLFQKKAFLLSKDNMFLCPLRQVNAASVEEEEFILSEGTNLIHSRAYCVHGVRYKGDNMRWATTCIADAIYSGDNPPADVVEFFPMPYRAMIHADIVFRDEDWKFPA